MYRYGLELVWDDAKDFANQAKHGFSFEEAAECFADPRGVDLFDPKHSIFEMRFYRIGKSKRGKILTVWYTMRGSVIRIIGAAEFRKMRRFYEASEH